MTPDKIKYSIQNKRLQIGFLDQATHYSVAVAFGLVAITVLYLFIQNFLANQTFSFQRVFELVIFIGFSILSYSTYIVQRNRLDLEELPINFSSKEFKNRLEKLARINNWEFISFEKLIVISKFKEKTIILFDNQNFFVTSIFDPDSFGFLIRIFQKPKLLSIIKNESRR